MLEIINYLIFTDIINRITDRIFTPRNIRIVYAGLCKSSISLRSITGGE